MSRRAPSWLALTPGEVYTLHFWPPYGDPEVQLAKHYTGWAEEGRLARRLTDHAFGRGARLTQVQREAGGTWVVADVQPGTRDREQQLKERGAARRCSVCKASRDIESGKLTREQALAQWENATEYERSLLREIFGIEPEAAKPAPVPVREITPAPQPEPLTITPEMEALVDALIESHDPELWFSPFPQAIAQAKAICRSCPHQASCLSGAMQRRETYGIWGGTDFNPRHQEDVA